MRNIITIAALLACGFLASCSKSTLVADEPVEYNKSTLTASYESNSSATRVGFEPNGSFYWTTGDQLGVTTNNFPDTFQALTLVSGAGSGSGEFTGSISGDIDGYYAVYPFRNTHSMLSSSSLKYNLPQTYDYGDGVDESYFYSTLRNWSEFQRSDVGCY